jgi:hypothetical protein
VSAQGDEDVRTEFGEAVTMTAAELEKWLRTDVTTPLKD